MTAEDAKKQAFDKLKSNVTYQEIQGLIDTSSKQGKLGLVLNIKDYTDLNNGYIDLFRDLGFRIEWASDSWTIWWV